MTGVTNGPGQRADLLLAYQSPLDLKAASLLQKQLAQRVRLTDDWGPVHHLVGLDVSHQRGSDVIFAAAVALDWPSLTVGQVATAQAVATLPYQPGFLAFREMPALLQALAKLTVRPDLLVVDGQGVAHPRGLGVAAHLGVLTNLPAIGSAKSRLVGEVRVWPQEPGQRSPLVFHEQLVGYVLQTRKRALPIYVSAGHRLTHETAADWVYRLCQGYRLSLPIRLAHDWANQARKAGGY